MLGLTLTPKSPSAMAILAVVRRDHYGVAGGVVFEQELDQGDDAGGFFSTGLRPPPERRVRPGVTF